MPRASSETEARIAFYRARIGGPATYPAYARLGLACLQKARETGQAKYHEEGLRHLQESLGYQRNFDALLGMALGLSERHRFSEALKYAEEAAEAMPGAPEVLGVLFDIRLARGEVAKAEQALALILEVRLTFEGLVRQAALKEYRGDLAGALASMTKAMEVAPRELAASLRAWAQVRIGSLRMAQCDANNARDAYLRALMLVPGYPFAEEHLAEWHAAHEHWKEAGELYQKLLKTRPEPTYRLALAEVYRQQGKIRRAHRDEEAAVAGLRRAVQDGAQDQFRPLSLALLEREGEAVEGLQWAQRDWELRPDVLAVDTLAWACWRNCQGDEALRLSKQALATGTRNPTVLLHAGIIRCGVEQDAEGQALLEQALVCPLAFGPHERVLARQARNELSRSH